MVPIGPVLGLLSAAMLTYVTPKMYKSRAVIEVKPQDSCGFYWSEADRIKSRNVLSKVIDNLDLPNQWGVDRETALEMLLAMVSSKEIKGGNVISIQASQ